MFRKAAVIQAGNYQDFPGFEDYYLWVRMLQKGYQGYNIQETVLDMRTGNGMYNRRGGKNYLVWVVRFQKCLLKKGFIDRGRFLKNCAVRLTVGMIPGNAREKFYHIFLRNAK